MARLVVSAVVGIAVGFISGNPALGFQAFAATYGLTGFLDPNQQVSGPRIDDLKGTTAQYGTPIPHVYGHPRIAGAIVWCSDKHEIATTEEAGGKGGPSTDVTTYTYTIDVRVLLTANEIVGVRRIWSNGKLVWTAADDADESSLEASGGVLSAVAGVLSTGPIQHWDRLTVYTGSSDQMPDPTEEAALGIENCPAYRGRGSVFIEGLNLGSSGYLPNLTFEVVRIGDAGEFGDGLLCHFDALNGSDIASALGPDVVVGVGGGLTSSESRFGGSSGDATGDTNVERYTASGITGSLNRSWRLEGWFFPTLSSSRLFTLDDADSAFQFDLSCATGTSAFSYNITSTGGAGGGLLGESALGPVLNEWNHIGVEYVAGETTLSIFCNGVSVGTFSSAVNPFLNGTWSNVAFGGSTYVDEQYLHFDMEPYGATYVVPTEPFSDGPITTLTAEDEPLEDVLEDIATRAGLAPSYIDFSSCVGQFVRSFAVSQVTPARTVMQTLADCNLQEFVEGNGLKTVSRGGASVATLAYSKLGASTGDQVEPLPLKRLNDIELPRQFAITYPNVLNDYQNGTEYSDRLLGGSTSVATAELPVGLTPTEAKRLADVRLVDAIAGIIQVGPVSITREYARLEPTDVIVLTGHDGSTFRSRVLKITDDGGMRTLECVLDDATAVNSSAVTDSDYESSSIVRALVSTDFELLDIPILRDADNDAGIYVPVNRSTLTGDWPGAVLFRGVNEAGWSNVASYTDRTFIGNTTTALAAWDGLYVFDEKNTVTVSGVGTLSNYSDDAILNGTADGYVIGDEILYAKRATLVSDGVYTLAGLLRARRGTNEAALAGSASGSRVVLIQPSGWRRVGFENGQLGAEFDFRAITLGQSIGSGTTQSITPMGIGLKPFSPVHVEADDNGDGTYGVTWKRRTRLSCRFGGALGINTPLGESAESYAVEVFDGASVTSTQTVTEEAVTVTASPGDVVRVYQISAIVGRGYVAELEL